MFWKKVEDILKADPSLRRSNEELALIDSYATIKSNLIISSGRGIQRKRARAFIDEVLDDDEYDSNESDDGGPQCPQCGAEIDGFRCNQHTIHLQCQACGGMMPSRADMNETQHCLGCDKTFCGAYWHAHRVTQSDLHPVCNYETFRPVSEHTITRIPFLAHEMNRHEQDITEKCIRQSGRTLQEVVAEWISKLSNREIDRTRMPLNHAERITAETHVCRDCYEKLVAFLLYWYRISMPKYRRRWGRRRPEFASPKAIVLREYVSVITIVVSFVGMKASPMAGAVASATAASVPAAVNHFIFHVAPSL
ncbi:hypothetical protein CCACVL1_25341 [Corchorus capsularis]|uniref:E3 ubiquitin-protein ligase CHFR cysteine rich domain-containing protein n=1 Tax=Corchorus capsularis TaxID=210143 RepID=A0A1R3GL46_COCAP|nr:hypothetical protein CCACVL1_25341 [Corchorus capsularis]